MPKMTTSKRSYFTLSIWQQVQISSVMMLSKDWAIFVSICYVRNILFQIWRQYSYTIFPISDYSWILLSIYHFIIRNASKYTCLYTKAILPHFISLHFLRNLVLTWQWRNFKTTTSRPWLNGTEWRGFFKNSVIFQRLEMFTFTG